MTFGEAAATHLRNLDDNLSIKPRTRDYWRECLAALQKSWPGLNETEVRKITQTDCREWARAYRKTVSPTRYNSTVSVLRHVLNVAVEAGVVYSNAAAPVKRVPVRGKVIALPGVEQFNVLIAEMPRTIWIADAHRGDGKRFVVRADEKLTAFLELQAAIQRRFE